METSQIPDIRYVMLCSLVLASSVIYPEAAFNAARTLWSRWKLFTARIRTLVARKPKRSAKSFWEIDMTGFEP